MIGPQVVKTTIRPNDGPMSPAAQQGTLALIGLIAAQEDPAVLASQQFDVVQIVSLLLQTAGRFHEGEARLESITGALLSGATWIAHHHGLVFEMPQDPRPVGH